MITSELMGQTKKAKITFTCTQEARDFLEKWAASERRTMSNLVEGLVDDAITAKGKPDVPVTETVKALQDTTKRDEDGLNAGTLLRLFASGERPSDGEMLVVANESGIELEQLWRMRDRLFPQRKKMNNGAT